MLTSTHTLLKMAICLIFLPPPLEDVTGMYYFIVFELCLVLNLGPCISKKSILPTELHPQ